MEFNSTIPKHQILSKAEQKAKERVINTILNPTEKESKIIIRIYKELYSAIGYDFVELVKNGTFYDDKIDIHFNDYEIDKSIFDEIVDRHLKNIKSSTQKMRIINTVLLGASPKFKSL